MAFAILTQPLALILELSSNGLNSNPANRMRLEYFEGGVPGNNSQPQLPAADPLPQLTQRVNHRHFSILHDYRHWPRRRAVIERRPRSQGAI